MHRLPLLLILLTTLAHGDTPWPLSLRDAEALWQQQSHALRLAETAVTGAEADMQTAGQRPNPTLSLSHLSISPQSGFGGGSLKDKKMDTQVRVDQLIERGGKRDLRVQGAQARLNAARSDSEDVFRQQRGNLRQAYYTLSLAQERLTLTKDTVALYRKSTDAGRLRLHAGDLSPVDLSRLQIDQGRAEADAHQAEADLAVAQQRLARLMGRVPDAARIVATDPWQQLAEQALQATALEERPDLVAARQRLSAAEADRELARAQRQRDVTVGFQLERNLQNAPTNSFGVAVSLPIFAWHTYQGDIARAEADYTAARIQLEQQESVARSEVAESRHVLLAAQARVKGLEAGLQEQAAQVAQAAELAYRKGAMSLMDLLDARRTLRQVQLETAAARADYARALSEWQVQAEFRK